MQTSHTFDIVEIALRTSGMPPIGDLEIAAILAEVTEAIRHVITETDHAMLCGLIAALLKRNGMAAEVLQ